MPVLAWYGYCREPQVMALSLRGSRSSQPIVLIGFLYFSKGMFVPMHVFIAMFAEMYKKIVVNLLLPLWWRVLIQYYVCQ